jgi:hypothetical protein
MPVICYAQIHLSHQLPEDPLDPEYQTKLMKHIQQQNINDNYANAMCAIPSCVLAACYRFSCLVCLVLASGL